MDVGVGGGRWVWISGCVCCGCAGKCVDMQLKHACEAGFGRTSAEDMGAGHRGRTRDGTGHVYEWQIVDNLPCLRIEFVIPMTFCLSQCDMHTRGLIQMRSKQ